MKKWKLCVVSEAVMVFAVLGTLILVQNVMSSADGKKTEFEFQLVEGEKEQPVSGNAVSGGEEAKEDDTKDENPVEEKEMPQDTENQENSSIESSAESSVEEREEPELVVGENVHSESSASANISNGYVKEKSALGEVVVSYAKVFQGVPYVYGGTDLPDVDFWTFTVNAEASAEGTEEEAIELYKGEREDWQDGYGVDCSGFVMKVFEKFDIKLPRTVKEQSQQGTEVKIKDIEPGDIIFYGTSNAKITHCGIYAGEDKVIHVSARTEVVKLSDMNYRRIAKVVRVVEE